VKETLAEIASLLAQGAPAGLADWWRTAQLGINRLLKMILVWPVAMVACAMWSSSIAQKVVPILALMPVFFFLYFMLKFVNPATVGMFAIPRARELVQKVARQVGILVAAECGLGLFLWFVPISNDRWLAPVLLLAVLAFLGLKLADVAGGIRAVLALLIVGIAVVFILGGRNKLDGLAKSTASNNGSLPPNYSPSRICDDAFNDDFDNSQKNLRYFDVTLHEGCFGGFVHLPKSWSNWYAQPRGEQNGFWIAYWHENSQTPLGPYGPNASYHFDHVTTVFRLEGHGTVRFYSNVAVPPIATESLAAPPTESPTGADASTIIVESATYGLSCNAASGNDTSHLASKCNGRSSCVVLVTNARPGGDPARGCDKDYLAEYRCTGDRSNLWKAAHEPLKNEGYRVVLNCAQRRPVDTSTTSSAPREAVADASAPAEPADKSEHPIAEPITTEMDEIMFAVNSCQFTGNSVICSLQFTNKGRDRDMRLGGQFGRTRIIDQSGREYGVQVLQLGAKECRGCAVVNRLVNDVPIAAGLSFANVSSEISVISLLEINYSMDGGGRWSTVQFRNVPVDSRASSRRPSDPSAHAESEKATQGASGGVRTPEVITKVEPTYTSQARDAKFDGTVKVQAIVGVDGRVYDIHIVDSPGLGLDDSIVEALSHWRFRPGQKNGKVVAVRTTISVNFKR
jgi:TonB family protein